jgi:hypothetical protein
MDRDINKCFSCGLVDSKIEAGGIYHCPNPFCHGCGATCWKTQNLTVSKTKDGIEITDMKEWLDKATAEINKMPYELGNKIMNLKQTKDTIKELSKQEVA